MDVHSGSFLSEVFGSIGLFVCVIAVLPLYNYVRCGAISLQPGTWFNM